MAPDGPAGGLETVIDDETLTISWRPGASGLCVVSFAGVELGLGGIRATEFRRSLEHSVAGRVSMIYVADRRRRWYVDGLEDRLAEVLNGLLRDCRTRRAVTLGNSMGGYAAVVFARRLTTCRTAIAFSPQSTVDPAAAPFETRYAAWAAGAQAWGMPDAAAELAPQVGYYLVFGGRDAVDLRHADRFRTAALPAAADIHIEPDADHRVAAWMRDRGDLYPLLERLILREPAGA